jgi:membrane-bound lytic murein transglycosylase B
MSCPTFSGTYRAMQRSLVANAAALRLIMKKLSASACGAATSTSATTPRPKLTTSQISVPEHRQKFVKQRNRSWRGSISLDRQLWLSTFSRTAPGARFSFISQRRNYEELRQQRQAGTGEINHFRTGGRNVRHDVIPMYNTSSGRPVTTQNISTFCRAERQGEHHHHVINGKLLP